MSAATNPPIGPSNPPALPPYLRLHADGVILAVKLQPRASKNEIGEALGEELRIKVTAPPVDAAANEALLHLLVERLECARADVQLIRGHTSRHKTILIRGQSATAIQQGLTSDRRSATRFAG